MKEAGADLLHPPAVTLVAQLSSSLAFSATDSDVTLHADVMSVSHGKGKDKEIAPPDPVEATKECIASHVFFRRMAGFGSNNRTYNNEHSIEIPSRKQSIDDLFAGEAGTSFDSALARRLSNLSWRAIAASNIKSRRKISFNFSDFDYAEDAGTIGMMGMDEDESEFGTGEENWNLPVQLPMHVGSMPEFGAFGGLGLAASQLRAPLPRSFAVRSQSGLPLWTTSQDHFQPSLFPTIETTAEPESFDDFDPEPEPEPASYPSWQPEWQPRLPAVDTPTPSKSPLEFTRRSSSRSASTSTTSQLSKARASAAGSAASSNSGIPPQTKEKKYNTIPAVVIALCSNCGTEKSSLWRRNPADGEPLCNGE